MFQFAGLATIRLWIQRTSIRESRDRNSFVNSPGLIADFHALHRLLTPRHPPYALSSLTTRIQNSPSQLTCTSRCVFAPDRPSRSLPTTISILRASSPSSVCHRLTTIALSYETPVTHLDSPAGSPSSVTFVSYRRCLLPLQPNCQRSTRHSAEHRYRPNGQKPHSRLCELPSSPSSTRSGKRLASTSLN